MDHAEVRAEFDRQWEPWVTTLAGIAPSVTREPGVCGFWTVHDVVNHVHAYARYHLVQVRAGFSLVEPASTELMGERDEMQGPQDTLDARNEAIRLAGLSLSWQQLLDECEWLRTQTLAWIDSLTQAQLDERVGWVEFWDPNFPRPKGDHLPVHVRRVRDVPAALEPTSVWQFVLPDKPPHFHVTEHLGQIRAWLTTGRRDPVSR
jgi:hypothetical protein